MTTYISSKGLKYKFYTSTYASGGDIVLLVNEDSVPLDPNEPVGVAFRLDKNILASNSHVFRDNLNTRGREKEIEIYDHEVYAVALAIKAIHGKELPKDITSTGLTFEELMSFCIQFGITKAANRILDIICFDVPMVDTFKYFALASQLGDIFAGTKISEHGHQVEITKRKYEGEDALVDGVYEEYDRLRPFDRDWKLEQTEKVGIIWLRALMRAHKEVQNRFPKLKVQDPRYWNVLSTHFHNDQRLL